MEKNIKKSKAKEKTYKEWLKAVRIDQNALLDVPADLLTDELCLEAVKTDYSAINYIPKEHFTKEICLAAHKKSFTAIRHVPKDLLELYKKNIAEE